MESGNCHKKAALALGAKNVRAPQEALKCLPLPPRSSRECLQVVSRKKKRKNIEQKPAEVARADLGSRLDRIWGLAKVKVRNSRQKKKENH